MALIEQPREVMVAFWRELDRLFKREEKNRGSLLHKGHIYWRLGLEHLLWGKLNTAIFYLAKSAREDRRRGDLISSAIALENLLKPLKRHKYAQWLYSQMSMDDREKFAVALLQTHDQSLGRGLTLIRDEYFNVIENKALRNIVQRQYHETFSVIAQGPPQPSYYICVFAIGSILEGILDDLLIKQQRLVWKAFLGLPGIGQDPEAVRTLKAFGANAAGPKGARYISANELVRMKTHHWDRVELGPKVELVRLFAKHGKPIVEPLALMEMYVIHDFRNLIHPTRLKHSLLDAPWYVAAVLFTFISHVAGNSWPKNLRKRLK